MVPPLSTPLPFTSFLLNLYASQLLFSSLSYAHSIISGLYPPLIRVYDVKDLSLKFERGLECEVVGFEVLSDDYSKMVVARADRIVEFHVKGGKLHQTRLPKPFRDIFY